LKNSGREKILKFPNRVNLTSENYGAGECMPVLSRDHKGVYAGDQTGVGDEEVALPRGV
jgi:hypothetical protein